MTGSEQEPMRADHSLALENEEEERLARTSREGGNGRRQPSSSCGSAIKHGKMAPESLADRFWPISNMPFVATFDDKLRSLNSAWYPAIVSLVVDRHLLSGF